MERSILFIERIFRRMKDEFTERLLDAAMEFIIEIDKGKLFKEFLKERKDIDLEIKEN